MKDIVIAFASGAVAALVMGSLVDTAAASTAFGVVFPAVMVVLERREREKDRKREAELRRELAAPQVSAPPGSREDGAPARTPPAHLSAQEELRALRQRAARPTIDWRRVAMGTVISLILVSLMLTIVMAIALLFAVLGTERALLVPPLLAASVMLGTGFWVGRTSAGPGHLDAAVMGSIVGVSVPLVLLLVGGMDRDRANVAWALVVFTGAGVLLASIGGLLGARRRRLVPRP